MKTLLVKAIACAAVLLPLSQVEAKTYGGFKPGFTFRLKVSERITSKSVGTKITKNVAVPAGVPKFNKGQIIKFKIGPKGQLTANGMSIPFKSDGGSSNVYNFFKQSGTSIKDDAGEVFKNTKNKPTGAALNFVRTKYSGFSSTVTTVTYSLEKP